MSSAGCDSPRPFDAANSQADMSWLKFQDDHQPAAPLNDMSEDATTVPTGIQYQTVDMDLTKLDQEPTAQEIKQEPSEIEPGPMDKISIDLTDHDKDTSLIKQESTVRPWEWKEMPRTIDLDDDTLEIKQECSVQPFGWKEMPHSINLDDDTQQIKQECSAQPFAWKELPRSIDLDNLTQAVKQEYPVQLSAWKEMPRSINLDDDTQEIKKERLVQPFAWKEMPHNIELSDFEDGKDPTVTPLGDNQRSMPSSGQPPTHADDMDTSTELPQVGQFNSAESTVPGNSNIGLGKHVLQTPNTKTKRRQLSAAQMRAAQAKLRVRALSRDKALAATLHGGNTCLAESSLESADGNPSDPAGGNHSDHMRIIEEGVEEDVEAAASRAMGEDQHDSLFVPQGSSSLKRSHAITVESDQEVEEVDGYTIPDTRGKPKRKRQAKQKPISEEEAAKLEAREREASFAIAMGNATGHRPINTSSTHDDGKNKKSKGKGKANNGAKARKPKPDRAPKKKNPNFRDIVAGFQSHDVLAEANANLEREALPTSHERDKTKHLRALFQSVPKGDRPGVREERERLRKAATNFGHGAVTAVQGGWKLKGLEPTLLHHQLLGASFMRDRERGLEQPFGGLLADEMGFGKTIMMIATMATNRPAPTAKARSTLIVCSPSLILQWQRELLNHASKDIFEQIIIHHGHSQIEGEGLVKIYGAADVVLTTYGQVCKSFPRGEPPEHLETEDEKRAWWNTHWAGQRGVLHKTFFHRVVLDESQVIKNHKAHTSIACQALSAHYRWAISGTPILNSIEEFYPYFKFLRAPLAGTYDEFRRNFCGKGDRIYTDRLQACVTQFMLRRTHVDLIFGKPIIKLPKCHQTTTYLDPTGVEIAVYSAIKLRYVKAINSIAKRATKEQIKRLTMALLTRLRQMTAHLFLVQHVMQDMFELGDVEQLPMFVKGHAPSQDMFAAIEELIAHKEDDEEPDIKQHDDDEDPQESVRPSDALLKKFENHLRALISNANTSEFSRRSTCPRCRDPPENPYVTSCMHVYCHDCLLGMAQEAARKDERTKCEECGVVYTRSEPCGNVKELHYEMGTNPDGRENQKKRHKPPSDLLKWIRKDWGVLPSTKSAAVVDQIDKWLTKEPRKKIIVFSQWRMM